jgi:hypothetical protein
VEEPSTQDQKEASTTSTVTATRPTFRKDKLAPQKNKKAVCKDSFFFAVSSFSPLQAFTDLHHKPFIIANIFSKNIFFGM